MDTQLDTLFDRAKAAIEKDPDGHRQRKAARDARAEVYYAQIHKRVEAGLKEFEAGRK